MYGCLSLWLSSSKGALLWAYVESPNDETATLVHTTFVIKKQQIYSEIRLKSFIRGPYRVNIYVYTGLTLGCE